MQTTAARIFAALDTRDPSITATAAALGVSKQAYSLARQRCNLSDDLCIRACLLTGTDPAPALISLHRDNAPTPEAAAAWENILHRLAWNPQTRSEGTTGGNDDGSNATSNDTEQDTNYATFDSGTLHEMRSFKTRRIMLAEQLCQWMLCIPRLRTTSPRFVYYADNWHVLEKIERFTASGEFETLTKDCPAFGAEELRAALDYTDRSETIEKPRQTTASTNQRQALTR